MPIVGQTAIFYHSILDILFSTLKLYPIIHLFIYLFIDSNNRMVKVYFTYKFTQSIGLAASKNSNFAYNPLNNQFVCGVNQYITIISAKTADLINMFYREGKNVPVRYVYLHASTIYAGYEDGEIIVWSYDGQIISTFDMHKTTVSWICVDDNNSKLISGSLDGSIIVWDLLSQQHHQIKSAHPSPITQLQPTTILIKGQPTEVLFSVGKDGFFRVWNLNNYLCIAAVSCQVTQAYSMYYDTSSNLVYVGTNKQDIVIIQIGDGDDLAKLCWVKGVFKKKSFGRTNQIFVEFGFMYLINSDKTIEIYKMLSGKDLEARKKRLQSRKKKQDPQQSQQPLPTKQQTPEPTLQLLQQKTIPFKFYNSLVHEKNIYLNNGTNIYSLNQQEQLTKGIGRTQQLCLEYPFLLQRSTNTINVYSSQTSMKLFGIQVKAEWCMIFSGAYVMVVGDAVGVWSLGKNQEIFRLEEKWTGCWVKGNKAMLWRQNELGFFQIGYDKNKNIRMKLTQSRRFQDKIIQASYKNKLDKYIVCLQSSQIWINHSDSHKQFLKLYGHKLPISSYSLSSDDNILATGSVDKDIRLWDMDFGHSIKTIFAHQEAVTAVRWVNQTHYLFSAGKDGHVKFWDMDTHELVMDFQECTMDVRGLVVSASGDMVVAGGLDEGFRIWKQTNDQTIASDMQEKQMQKLMIEDYAKQKLDAKQQKTRYEDLKHGQQIIQALQQKQPPKKLLSLLKKIPAANLKSCLSFLHERHMRRLQQYLKLMIEGNYEQQTCWRVLRELNRGSQLGKQMRDIWKPVQNMVILNTQILKTLLKCVKEENQFV